MSHFYQPDDDTWEGRMDSYIEEAEKQITALRAALDQERADNERLRAFVFHADDCKTMTVRVPDGLANMLLNPNPPAPAVKLFEELKAKAVCTCGLSALLSGRGEGGNDG